MKTLIKYYLQASIVFWVIYLIIYLFNAFYQFDLYNPFWWITEIPTNKNIRENIMLIVPSIEIIKIGSSFHRKYTK